MATTMMAAITTTMTDDRESRALLRLMAWLSPAFPIGAFSYSAGLERAVHDGTVHDRSSLSDWIGSLLAHGTMWNDGVLFAEAHRSLDDPPRLEAVVDLAAALAGSAERHRETMLLGEAFLAAAAHWPHPVLDRLAGGAAYPVAVGAVAGAHGIGAVAALAAYFHATASNAVSVAIRCGVFGQREGVEVIAWLEPMIAAMAGRAAATTLDDLGSATILADIASLCHETLETRLFRS